MKMKLTQFTMDESNSSFHLYGSDECSDIDVDMDMDLDLDLECNKNRGKKRSRQNLSHLSAEEKMKRRQMKNRIAAQTARDRKKAKMDLLVARVAKLSKETMQLKKQMTILTDTNSKLLSENLSLRAQLKAANTVKSEKDDVSKYSCEVQLNSPVVPICPVESAELIHVSPKKIQGSEKAPQSNSPHLKSKNPTSTLLMMQFVCLLMNLMNPTNCSNGLKSAPANCSLQMRQAAVARIAREMDQPAKLKKLVQKVIYILQLRKRLKAS